jgi:hypothetical protein
LSFGAFVGDAFLLTWKLEQSFTIEQKSLLADQALLAFCKTLVELIRYEEFIVNFTAAATGRLYKKFPDYHVRIGSGLHVGWAIEGAIGSNRKIDASYLSPHVNFTEFLESSTKAYGVPLLMSEPFFNLLSPTAQGYCRQVDRVRRSESEDPIGLYTYDSDIHINFADANRKRPKANAALGAAPHKRRASTFTGIFTDTVSSTVAPGSSAGHPQPVRAARRASVVSGLNAEVLSQTATAGAIESPPSNMGPARSKRSSTFINTAPDGTAAASKRSSLIMMGSRPTEREGEIEDAEAGLGKQTQENDLHNKSAAPIIVVPLYRAQLWETDHDLVDLRYVGCSDHGCT